MTKQEQNVLFRITAETLSQEVIETLKKKGTIFLVQETGTETNLVHFQGVP